MEKKEREEEGRGMCVFWYTVYNSSNNTIMKKMMHGIFKHEAVLLQPFHPVLSPLIA